MRKLRFKNRNGVLYFGLGETFKSSKMKDTKINRNILSAKFRDGALDEYLFGVDSSHAVTMNDLFSELMRSKSISLKHKSVLAYTSILKSNIIPYFKDINITEVKPVDIRNWQDTLINKGLKRSSINIARVLMREVFKLAMLKEMISINPMSIVEAPKIKSCSIHQDRKKTFSLDEIDAILNYAHGDIKNFLGISFFTGMRSGELLALKWEDVDFSSDTISINKTIASGIINSPKTISSHRDIEMLDKAKEFFKSQRLQTGLKNGYVFLSGKGTYHFNNTTMYKKYLKILDALKIERKTLHSTRHTFASIMLNNGVDALWVSSMLGHENLNITLKVYTHFMPKKEKMSLSFLEKRYKNGTNNL